MKFLTVRGNSVIKTFNFELKFSTVTFPREKEKKKMLNNKNSSLNF